MRPASLPLFFGRQHNHGLVILIRLASCVSPSLDKMITHVAVVPIGTLRSATAIRLEYLGPVPIELDQLGSRFLSFRGIRPSQFVPGIASNHMGGNHQIKPAEYQSNPKSSMTKSNQTSSCLDLIDLFRCAPCKFCTQRKPIALVVTSSREFRPPPGPTRIAWSNNYYNTEDTSTDAIDLCPAKTIVRNIPHE